MSAQIHRRVEPSSREADGTSGLDPCVGEVPELWAWLRALSEGRLVGWEVGRPWRSGSFSVELERNWTVQ